ncbi:hypothetical protein LUPINE_115 [Microbacterium phage Lupine]|nr:hypothetical protein LUPINE_5 [Microbacterium phage Lupine]QDH48123.1 hypothetical protein LUPINE_115 [Microbacterium phage Lupine]
MNVREIETADWEAGERAEALALPYEVISSPYGETISERYSTYDAAEAAYRANVALTGEYMTSWGMVPVNTEVVVNHYVNSTPEVTEVDACIDCSQAVAGISAHERGEEYPAETMAVLNEYGMRLVSGDCGEQNEHCVSFTWSPCELCGSSLGGERHRVAILPA